MKCNEIKKLLNPYIDNELSEEDTNRVKIHLQECIDCAEETSELDKVQQMIHELPKLKAPIELVENVRQRIVDIKQPEASVFLRYRWVIGSFASAAAVFLLVYIAIINSYQYRDYPVRESVMKEQTRPEGLPTESKTLALRTAPMLHREGEPPKDEPIKLSDSSVATLAQNIRITTNDIDETKDKIYEVANVTRGGFDGFSDKKNKEGDEIEYKPEEKTTELRRDASIKGESQRSTISGFTSQPSSKIAKQSAQKGPQQYVVKVTIPLSQKDAFIQNLKSNISGEMTLSQMQVASVGKLMITKRLAVEIAKEENKELLLTQAVEDKSEKQELRRRAQEIDKDSKALQPKTKTVHAKGGSAEGTGKQEKTASDTEEGAPGLVTKPPAPAQPTASSPTPPPPPSAPSAPSYSDEIAKNDAKDKSSDNQSLRKQKDLLKAQDTKDKGDTQIGGGAGSKKEESSEKLDELQNSTNEIMIEFTIIIEEKIK